MKWRKRRGFIIIMLMSVMLFMISCTDQASQEVGEEQEESFVISGLINDEITVTVGQLKQITAVTRDVVSVNSAGEKNGYTAKGALLEDVLKQYGKSQKDINGIRLIAGDGYAIEVPAEVLKNREIILAYEMDGEPLDEKTKPVRVVVPEERAMYWVRNLTRIEALQEKQTAELSKIYFLETAVTQIQQQDYTYYESVDKAVKVKDLLAVVEENGVEADIHFKAADGLEKNEAYDIFVNGFFKITGKETPAFLSPDMPKGMYVKDILWFTCGKNAVFCVEEGINVIPKHTQGDKSGILLSEVLKNAGLVSAEKYILTAKDGYEVEIAAADMDRGLVYISKDGLVCTYFEGLQKNTSVKELLSIEAIQ
ncbi:MAG: molybdopterin-dependent oxidoreductase [Bacillota bacterium]